MSMIGKYVFGSPLPTGAVTMHVPVLDEIPYVSVREDHSLSLHMGRDTAVYGLGPHVRGLNKRGWIYESFNVDESKHTEDKRRLYGSHNYLFIDAPKPFGLFIDTPGFITFDIGYTHYDELTVTVKDGNYVLYVFDADSLSELAKTFDRLTGSS